MELAFFLLLSCFFGSACGRQHEFKKTWTDRQTHQRVVDIHQVIHVFVCLNPGNLEYTGKLQRQAAKLHQLSRTGMIVASKNAALHVQSHTNIQKHRSSSQQQQQQLSAEDHLQIHDHQSRRTDLQQTWKNPLQPPLRHFSCASDEFSIPASEFHFDPHLSDASHTTRYSTASQQKLPEALPSHSRLPLPVPAPTEAWKSVSWWLKLLGQAKPPPELQMSQSFIKIPTPMCNKERVAATESSLSKRQRPLLRPPQRSEVPVEVPLVQRQQTSLRLPAAVYPDEEHEAAGNLDWDQTSVTPILSLSSNIHFPTTSSNAEPVDTCITQPQSGYFEAVHPPGQLTKIASGRSNVPSNFIKPPHTQQKQVSPSAGASALWSITSTTSTEDLRLTLGRTTPSYQSRPPAGSTRSSFHSLSLLRSLPDVPTQTTALGTDTAPQSKPILRTSASERSSLHARSLLLRQPDLLSHNTSLSDLPAPHLQRNKSVSSTNPLPSRLHSTRQGRGFQQPALLHDRLLLRPFLLSSRQGGQECEAYLCTLQPQEILHSPFSTFADIAVDPDTVFTTQHASSMHPVGGSYSSQQPQHMDVLGGDIWDNEIEQLALARYLEMDERPSVEPDRRPTPFDACKKIARCEALWQHVEGCDTVICQ